MIACIVAAASFQPFSQHLRLPHALGACDPQVASGDCPHTLFYGPPGAGKKTLILGLLRQIYGAGVERLKVTASQFSQGAKYRFQLLGTKCGGGQCLAWGFKAVSMLATVFTMAMCQPHGLLCKMPIVCNVLWRRWRRGRGRWSCRRAT